MELKHVIPSTEKTFGKAGLEPVEKTIIDRCVRLVYREYLADPIKDKLHKRLEK